MTVFAPGRAVFAQDWSIQIAWTSPGDDGIVGTASEYDIRYSVDSITDASWALATQATGEPAPQIAGQEESFQITGLQPLTTYYVAIKTRDEVHNWSGLSNIVSKTTGLSTGIDEGLLPDDWQLEQNYPNPFNPGTHIQWYSPVGSHVRIDLFNILGEHVRCLLDQTLPAGQHQVYWDGTDKLGGSVASGVYFYRLRAHSYTSTRSMTLLR